MKQTFVPLLLVFVSGILSSCLKEKLDPENIEGTWQYETVRYTGNYSDTMVKQKGTFSFKKSTNVYNAGGTVYGDFCEGSGDFPSLSVGNGGTGQLFQRKIDFSLTKPSEPSNYNYRNLYEGSYGYFSQGLNNYGFVRMSMISKDEVNIRFYISQNSNVVYNVHTMKLKRM
jgi:hypothetical protein